MRGVPISAAVNASARWEKIAEAVDGKSAHDCMERVRVLRAKLQAMLGQPAEGKGGEDEDWRQWQQQALREMEEAEEEEGEGGEKGGGAVEEARAPLQVELQPACISLPMRSAAHPRRRPPRMPTLAA